MSDTAKRWRVAGLFALGTVLAAFAFRGVTAANDVPATKAVDDVRVTTANDVKPADCNSISLTHTVSGSGTIVGTPANDLVVGDGGAVQIDGADGDDCLLGSMSDDVFVGGLGYDICIGNGGFDTFDPSCEETR